MGIHWWSALCPQIPTALTAGAAYVYTRSEGVWTEQAILKPTNSEAYDYFGESVSLDGDTLIVGSSSEDTDPFDPENPNDNNNALDSGAVYVFVRNEGNWVEQAMLKASNAEEWDYFGGIAVLNGDTIATGSAYESSDPTYPGEPGENNNAPNSGAVYIFRLASDIQSTIYFPILTK